MANMRLIEAKTVGSGGVAFITFSAIPQTYTDIKILASSRDNRSGQPNDDIGIQVGYNGTINTGSIYTYYRGYGTGGSAGSDNNSGTALYGGFSTGSTATASVFGNNSIYFGNYTSSNNKTVSFDGVSENNDSTSWQVLNAGLVATSNPITDIKLFGADASLLSEHTTFYLYGISSTIASGAKAYGGYVTEDANYFYHTFLASGAFTPTVALTNVDFLVIAGGGGGSYGGGGAGGLRSTVTATGGGASLESKLSLSATAYTVTVGAGGAQGSAGNSYQGQNGSDSVFSTITSTGGGGSGYTTPQVGGSGAGRGNTGSGAAATSSPVQGYAGGSGTSGGVGTGGGGGAGAVGGNGTASPNVGGNGGNGVQITAFANATQTGVNNGYYAGGGGGGYDNTNYLSGAGGLGGGGNGTRDVKASAGVANTGGGGAGSYASGADFSNGGSGLVIVRYAK